MHRITAVTLTLALVAGGCAGANPPLETSEPPMARQAPYPAAGELRRLARRLPQPGAGRRASGRRSSTPPSAASASTPRWCGSTAGRPSSPSRSGSISTAPPRSARVETGRAQARSSSPRRSPRSSARYGVDGDVVLAIWGMEIELRRQPRLDAGDREPRHARLRGPPPRLRRGAADRRAPDHPGRRHRPGAHGRLLGRGDGPHPVHPDELPRERRRLHRRRPPRRLGRRPDRRARLGRELPRQGRLAARPRPGASRCGCRRASTTARPTSRTAARSRDWRARGVTRLDGSAAARPRPGGDHRPGRRARPGLRRLPELLRHQDATTTPPPTRWASATSATGSPAAARSPAPGRAASASCRRTEKIELQRAADRPRLRHRHHRRGDRPEHHHRDPRLPERRRA